MNEFRGLDSPHELRGWRDAARHRRSPWADLWFYANPVFVDVI